MVAAGWRLQFCRRELRRLRVGRLWLAVGWGLGREWKGGGPDPGVSQGWDDVSDLRGKPVPELLVEGLNGCEVAADGGGG